MRFVAVAVVAVALGIAPARGASMSTFVASSRATAPSFADPHAAEGAGYELNNVAGPIEHWVNGAYARDGRVLDATRPEGLVYQRDDEQRRLVAVFYFLDEGRALPATGGGGWHTHPSCFGPAGAGIPVPGGPCPPGTSRTVGPSMLHVWLDAGWSPYEATVTPAYVCTLARP